MVRLYAVLLAVLMVLAFAAMAEAQTVVTANQVTVAWDAVSPIEAGDVMSYEVFRARLPLSGDRQNPAAHEKLGSTPSLQYTVTFNAEGRYIIGVRTVRNVNGTGTFTYSDINWSDDNGEGTPVPFVIEFYVRPGAPLDLRFE
jgi:hypothetical protein